ncbi:MAG: IS21 family transposase, partial [Acidobacteriota bacterium]
DNLKSAVIERQDGHIRFNNSLMELSSHYRFHAKACAPYAGNQKGRVERAIRYIRENFFEARPFVDLRDLNQQLDGWRDEIANTRPWPQNRERSVSAAFADEQGILIPLPDADADTSRIIIARSGKRPYLQIDGNHYSIPHEFVLLPLTVRLSAKVISIFNEDRKIAEHNRSMAKGIYIEDLDHRQALVESKKVHANHRDRSLLVTRLPDAGKLLPLWLERGENMAQSSRRLLSLLDEFREADVTWAILEALAKNSPTIDSIAYLLRSMAKPTPPRPRLNLPERLKNMEIRSHDPSQYDILSEIKEPHPDERSN